MKSIITAISVMATFLLCSFNTNDELKEVEINVDKSYLSVDNYENYYHGAPYIKGYPDLNGNTITCYLLNNAVCVVIISEPTPTEAGEYSVPDGQGGQTTLYGTLRQISSTSTKEVYEVVP